MAYTNSTTANYISLHGAVKKDGTPIDFATSPLTEDISVNDVVWVKLGQCNNSSGTLVDAFEIMVDSVAKLQPTVVYLYTYSGFTTITHFIGGLINNEATIPLCRYDNLIAVDRKDITATSRTANSSVSVLLNTAFIPAAGRRYLASSNSTVVPVKITQRLVPTVFEFRANQTIAGSYLFFYTSA